MKKTIRWMQNYLLYALPFVLICMGWQTIQPETTILTNANLLIKMIWEVLAWNLILWFVTLTLFLIFLVVIPEAREKTLTRLANLKERDEREQLITGRAARSAYISTISVLILLLFMSIFSFNMYRVPQEDAVNGKTGFISIGLSFDLLDEPIGETKSRGNTIIESHSIPLSKTAIILGLIIWQLAVFSFSARRERQV